MITFFAVPGAPHVLAPGPLLPDVKTMTISWLPAVGKADPAGCASRTSASNACESAVYAPPTAAPATTTAASALLALGTSLGGLAPGAGARLDGVVDCKLRIGEVGFDLLEDFLDARAGIAIVPFGIVPIAAAAT